MEYRQKKVTHTSSAGIAARGELIDSAALLGKMCIGAFQIIPFWKYLEVALPVCIPDQNCRGFRHPISNICHTFMENASTLMLMSL